MGCPLICEFIPNDAVVCHDLLEGGGKTEGYASKEKGADGEEEGGMFALRERVGRAGGALDEEDGG